MRISMSLVCVLLGSGCGRSLPPASEPDVARKSLETALVAWKKGDTPESLQQAQPPIHFNEPRWQTGCRLESYKVLAPEPFGREVKMRVMLSYKTSDGEAHEHETAYTVDTGTRIVIGPADFLGD